MTVYIYFRNRRWAIKCPYCHTANKITARQNGKTLFCGKCQSEITIRHTIRKGEDINWEMKKKTSQNIKSTHPGGEE